MSDNKFIMKALNQRPIAYYPIYRVMTGTLTGGVLLSQLMFWFGVKDKIYKTDDDIRKETELTKNELRASKIKIRELPFIKVTREGNPAKTYNGINWKKYEKAMKRLTFQISEFHESSCVNFTELLHRVHIDYKVKDKSLTTSAKSKTKPCKKFPKIIKTKINNKPKQTKIVNQDKFKLNKLSQDCLDIWIANGGKGYTARAKTTLKNLNIFTHQLFNQDINPYTSIVNEDQKRKRWSFEEFEKSIKRYMASKTGENIDLLTFIFQKSFNGKVKARSRLLQYHEQEEQKYEFKDKTAQYILKYYQNQIGNHEEVNPGVFVNTAKSIHNLEESFTVNPSFMHPENQLWYKYMQYVSQELKDNSNFIPAYMSSNNFVEKFKIKAQKNGALLKRSK